MKPYINLHLSELLKLEMFQDSQVVEQIKHTILCPEKSYRLRDNVEKYG